MGVHPFWRQYLTRGKHRRPTTTGRNLVVAATSVAIPVASAPSASAADIWDKVATCESGNDWGIDTGNSFYGGLQFTHDTWAEYGGHEFASEAHRASPAEQKKVAQRTLEVQGPGAWPVCSRKAGLTRDNGEAETSHTAGKHRKEDKHESDEIREQSGKPRHAKMYVVKDGDTLSRIADAHDADWHELYADNRAVIDDPESIFPGERIRLEP